MNATVYDRNAEFYVDFVDRGLQSNRYARLLALMTELIGARLDGARVCDLCCGEGYLGRHLVEHGAREILGIDTSAALLERARQRASSPRLSYRREDAQAISSLEDGTFDVVASQLAMMDVADHRALFVAVRRVLASGGVFAFSIVNDLVRAGFALERLEEPLDGSDGGGLLSEVPMVLVIAARAV